METDKTLQVTRYSPNRVSGVLSTLKAILRAFPRANALGYRLATRNIRSRYRQSALGIFWAVIPPVGNALIWIILNMNKVVSVSGTVDNYPLYAITGTTLWSVFASCILTPVQTVLNSTSILTKINFPRESLVYSAIYEICFTTAISFLIILAEFLFFRIPLGLSTLLFVPGLLTLGLLGLALSLMIVQVSVLYRGVYYALPSVIQFGMYLSPVVYSRSDFSGFAGILNYNPVSPVLDFTRSSLMGAPMADGTGTTVLFVFLASLLVSLTGLVVQRLTAEILIERMGS